MVDEADTDVLKLTATIVSAHVRNNQVAADALPELIQSVWRSFGDGRHDRTSTSATDARRANPQIGASRLHRLFGGREEAEDAQAAPAGQLRNDT